MRVSSASTALLLVAALSITMTRAAETVLFTDGRELSVLSHESLPDGGLKLYLIGGELVASRDVIAGILVDLAGEEATPGPDTAPDLRAETIEDMAARLALELEVEPELVAAVIAIESNGDPFAVSHKGAAGLMQLMPGTAQRWGVSDVFDPAQNLRGGILHLKSLLQRYRGDLGLALAAYNAGEAAVDRHGGIPPYRETTRYVIKVLNRYLVR